MHALGQQLNSKMVKTQKNNQKKMEGLLINMSIKIHTLDTQTMNLPLYNIF